MALRLLAGVPAPAGPARPQGHPTCAPGAHMRCHGPGAPNPPVQGHYNTDNVTTVEDVQEVRHALRFGCLGAGQRQAAAPAHQA